MIVSLDALNAHLGFTTGDDEDRDALLTALLGSVEQAFLTQCGRAHRPFAVASEEARTDVLDGTGVRTLFVDAPIEELESIVIGEDPDSPDEELELSNLVWRVGSTMVQRRDGLAFGAIDTPGIVHVTYVTSGEAPEDAVIAIQRATAAVYLQRGAEDVRAESEGGVRSEFAAAFEDPTWTLAVETHREYQVG